MKKLLIAMTSLIVGWFVGFYTVLHIQDKYLEEKYRVSHRRGYFRYGRFAKTGR